MYHLSARGFSCLGVVVCVFGPCGVGDKLDSVVGGCGGGGTPGPIPNPEAKPSSADGTALVRVWESRSPPTSNVRQCPAGDRRGILISCICRSCVASISIARSALARCSDARCRFRRSRRELSTSRRPPSTDPDVHCRPRCLASTLDRARTRRGTGECDVRDECDRGRQARHRRRPAADSATARPSPTSASPARSVATTGRPAAGWTATSCSSTCGAGAGSPRTRPPPS